MENLSMQQELDQILKGYAAQATAPNPGQVSVELTPAPPATAPQVQVQESPKVDQVPTPEPTPAPVAVTPAVKVDVDALVDSWDSEQAQTPVTPVPVASAPPVVTPTVETSSMVLSELAKVLGKDNISREEAIKVVQEIKSKVEDFSTLPPNLVKAVEIARSNGNYLEYLGVNVIDWSKEDPVILYENYIEDQLRDQTGQVDYERVDKFLDKIDEDEKELRGRELQRQYINAQAQQKAYYEAQAKAEKSQFENTLRRTLDSLDKIADFKLSPSHKEELFSDIVSGRDLKETDLQTRVFNAFVKKYFTKLDAFRKTQIRNSVKKEILDEVTVPVIKPASEQVVTQTGATKFSLDDYIKTLPITRN